MRVISWRGYVLPIPASFVTVDSRARTEPRLKYSARIHTRILSTYNDILTA